MPSADVLIADIIRGLIKSVRSPPRVYLLRIEAKGCD